MKLAALLAALLAACSNADVSSSLPSLPARSPLTLRQNPVASGLKSIDPRPVQYTCDASKQYKVSSIEELKAARNDWECLFAQGSWTAEVPLGNWYGDVLEAANTNGPNFIYEALWEGKVSMDTRCNHGQDITMGFNVIQGQYRFPFQAYVSPFKAGTVDSVEMFDAYPAMTIDYTVDFATLCPTEPAPGTYRVSRFASGLGNPFPGNTAYDLLRIVGRTADGANIWLGRVLARQQPGDAFSTVSWFALRNYDSGTAVAGTAAFTETFTGTRQGAQGLTKDGIDPMALQQQGAKQAFEWNKARLNRLAETPKLAALGTLDLIRP